MSKRVTPTTPDVSLEQRREGGSLLDVFVVNSLSVYSHQMKRGGGWGGERTCEGEDGEGVTATEKPARDVNENP